MGPFSSLWVPYSFEIASEAKSNLRFEITYLSMCILFLWYEPFWQPLRPLHPQNSLRGQIQPQIWNQLPQLPIYPPYCLHGVGPSGSLRGHYSPQTASEVKSDLTFEISDPDYLLIDVHIAYMVWAILAASEATTASKQPRKPNLTSDLKSVTSLASFRVPLSDKYP